MEDKEKEIRDLAEKQEFWDDEHLGRDNRYLPGWWMLPALVIGAFVWAIIIFIIRWL